MRNKDTSTMRSNLTDSQRALLEERLRGKPISEFQPQVIRRRAHQQGAPLSYGQQRLWFLQQSDPESPSYNIPSGLRVKGPLDVGALEKSLLEVVKRHEVLRTTFEIENSELVQVINEPESVKLQIVDLSHYDEACREEKGVELLTREAKRPFDLARGPLFKPLLARLNDDDHLFLMNWHHSVFDGWSFSIFFQEQWEFYEAILTGEPADLPELPIQYADFAVWQREWMTGEVLERGIKYWKEQLTGAETLILPGDNKRQAIGSNRGGREKFKISRELSEELRGLSRESGATMYMSLLAAFKILLSRYSGQEDIVVGSPVAGRNVMEVEGLIGFFVNTLALRTDLSGGPSYKEVLKRVKEVALGGYAHQEVPFEKLVEEIKPERSLSRAPLFQVAFVLQNTESVGIETEGVEIEMKGVKLSKIVLENETAKFDITLSMVEGADGLTGSLEYSTDIFDAATIKRMIGHFEVLLRSITESPQKPIKNLSILSRAERRQMVEEWNDTKVDYGKDICLHELFEAQVERTPDNIALVYEQEEVSYAELNRRANQLGHYLRRLGVGAEVLVGTCMERSIEMIVGILGVLKAGGAYVPLDPSHPDERLDFILEDTGVAVVLTQRRLKGVLPHRRAKLIYIDAGWSEIAKQSESNLQTTITPDNLAYVIYTSGSTGRPKGAMLPHKGVSNRVIWQVKGYPMTQEAAVLQQIPLSFDPSVTEIYSPLICGARLVLARDGWQKDSVYIARLVAEQKVTDAFFVPSMLQGFVQEASAEKCRSLKRVESAGEALSIELEQKFLERLGAELYNFYGPTETSVSVMYYKCRKDDVRVVPLGKPVANVELYILDKWLNLVPIGVAGELHIGGKAPGRGYLNRADLTAEKFIPDPFSKEQGARLYKSGDLARYLPDGNIEFLGRVDSQVKVRGNRIELGEIEAVLSEHEKVKEAIAVVREEATGGDKRLVAYAVGVEGSGVGGGELRRYLVDRLPDYMVPNAVVILEQMPRLPNGKTNRAALPSPEWGKSADKPAYVAPRTPTEEAIAEIWKGALNVEQVSVEADFFEIGGHSLLGTQVVLRINQAFNLSMPLRWLFEKTKISDLAVAIEEELIKEIANSDLADAGTVSD